MSRPGSVLVTGGAGYVGSHVVLALLAAGWPVVVLDDLSTGRLRVLHDACTVVRGDIGDRALVADTLARHDVAAVIHLAGSLGGLDSMRKPLTVYENNTAATLELLRTCSLHGLAAFVYASTAKVYGAPERSPVTEDFDARPIHPYGASKLMVERMLSDAGQAFDLPYAILRCFTVAGADPMHRCGQTLEGPPHLIQTACEAALGLRDHVPVFGTDYPTADGTCIRDFIHVSDLALAHVAALERLVVKGGSLLLNCGCGRGLSVRQVLHAVERVSGVQLPIVERPRRAGDAVEVVADDRRLRATLDWRPQHDDLDRMVGDALAWMRLALAERDAPRATAPRPPHR